MAQARLIWRYLFARGRTHQYGEHASQCCELHLPKGPGPHPVIVLIHGGSWRARFGKRVMRSLAVELRRRGWAVWNIEYRRVGEGGGWPETFEDVAAAIDGLAQLEDRLDLRRVFLLGHSAGGQLALWAAGRESLGAGSPGAVEGAPIVRPCAVAALAGVCDLAGGYADWHGGAVLHLMGGSPEGEPERYANADPMAHVPLSIDVLLVHGVADEVVSVRYSRSYAEATLAAGGRLELVEIEGESGRHRVHIYPEGPGWQALTGWLERELDQAREKLRASSTNSRTPKPEAPLPT
jgi:acetyl esterase/lipase